MTILTETLRPVALTSAIGWCYKTSFSDYKCRMQSGASQMILGQPAPTTF
jgi:hypothetical protein